MNNEQRLSSNQLLEVLSLSKNATAIYTTHDIIIETANDAMIAFWGKDRAVIGKPLEEAVPELKGQPFIGMLQKVLNTGITEAGEGIAAELLIEGKLRTSYYDFEYRAIKNSAGETYCILHTAADVTARVLGEMAIENAREQKEALESEQALNEELAAANEELNSINRELHQTEESLRQLNIELEDRVAERTRELTKNEARLRYLLADAPVAMAVFTGRELIIEAANKKVLEAWGKTPEIIGMPLHIAIPELVGQEFLGILDNVYTSGEPYYGNEVKALLEQNGIIEEVYSNFVYHPLKNASGKTDSIMLAANIVTEQVKARKQIEASEKRFRFMLNAIPQQVWTALPNGALDYVNQVVCDDFGDGFPAIVGHGWQKYIHPDDLPLALTNWVTSLETGEEYVVEFRLLFNDGVYRWHMARALPFIEEGQIKLWLGTNTNIDDRKSNEQKKDEFLSIASHELKTPLTSIKAFNQLMKRTSNAEKQESFINKSSEHIVRLEKLINDLLDVTRINAGKMEYSMEPFSFKMLLADTVESVQHISPTHNIILETVADVTYVGDQYRLEQVVNNFLTNAVKYSPGAEKVLVNSKIDHNNLIVSVKDFGIGIAEQDLDHLFDRYYRVDSTSMRFEGLGLGLFISSQIIKGHKGSFWIDSEEGKGSTFYFKLPLNASGKSAA
ncbi:ATP-binding protein [Mucilaginibacter agri]|uniref:histidine kinase n=1 Tax=Mucilaginibacter agri TaxID=2695265 RepID=A0A965ZGK4_9SPHI|nr:ATP-binding protein [Mucilaginibacter agri]NCD69361.1 PAS domain-containing protein [Mucilaginibacter agri]